LLANVKQFYIITGYPKKAINDENSTVHVAIQKRTQKVPTSKSILKQDQPVVTRKLKTVHPSHEHKVYVTSHTPQREIILHKYHRELFFQGFASWSMLLLDLTVTKVAAWNASGGVCITQEHHQNKNNNFWYHRFQGSIHKLIS